MSEPKKYTAEVLRAMEEQGIARPEKPAPPPVPEGQLPYHIAVGTNRMGGTASPEFIASQLRQLADLIERTTP